jgi:hypothetical protein
MSPLGYARATVTASTSAVTAGEGCIGGTFDQSSSDDHAGEAGLLASDRQTYPVSHLGVNSVIGALLCMCHPHQSELAPLYGRRVCCLDRQHHLGSCSPPVGSNVVTDKWILKHKFYSDGSLERYKAHCVLRCFTQRPGINYYETFSPVVKPVMVCTMLSLVVYHSWPVHYLDVKNVFMYGTLSETVYYS